MDLSEYLLCLICLNQNNNCIDSDAVKALLMFACVVGVGAAVGALGAVASGKEDIGGYPAIKVGAEVGAAITVGFGVCCLFGRSALERFIPSCCSTRSSYNRV